MKICKTKQLGDKEYHCYFELTLQIIGGKWKPVIIYHLGMNPVLRFGELRKGIAKITEKMLTQQLRELEKDGLVHREVYHQVPPKVEYSLTDLGKTILPILVAMRNWGKGYEDHMGGTDMFPQEEGYEPKDLPQNLVQYACEDLMKRQ